MAVKQGIFVPLEYVFFDVGVRGFKQHRVGLNSLRSVLAKRAIQVLLVLKTNRLNRKTYKSLQFVEEEVVARGIRAIFVASHVDTNDKERWRTLLNILSAIDEFVVGMYADNIRAAHESLFLRRIICMTIPFGYKGEPIPGELTKRKRPRQYIVIDPESSRWVVQIFTWYVVDGVAMNEIARRLNADETIPLPPRCMSGAWDHDDVRRVLGHPCYRGWWQYGKTESVWLPAKDYTRQMPRDQPLKAAQFEELRIVSDELWHRAQNLLAEEKQQQAGRKPQDGDRLARPRVLNGFFFCVKHDRPLYVGGPHGKGMFCEACRGMPAEDRPLFSQLNRALALRLTCKKLAELISGDAQLVQNVIAACQQEAGVAQRPDPAELPELRIRCDKLSKRIQFVLANGGSTETDTEEAVKLLRELRAERQQLANKIALLEAAQKRQMEVPTESQVLDLLTQLDDTLSKAAQAESPEQVHEVREVVRLLTGGRIELVQQGERRAQNGWLQGRFRVRLVDSLAQKLTETVVSVPSEGVEVVIDYRELSEAEKYADQARALYDAGKLIKQIATELKISRNLAHDAVQCGLERRGERMPDGRSRRSTLDRKHLQPPKYQEIADEVMRLYRERRLLGEIADRLGCDRNTVTKAIAFWHTTRGLPVPDGRSRRKDLPRKPAPPAVGPLSGGGTAAA